MAVQATSRVRGFAGAHPISPWRGIQQQFGNAGGTASRPEVNVPTLAFSWKPRVTCRLDTRRSCGAPGDREQRSRTVQAISCFERLFESNVAFDSLTGDLYFVRSFAGVYRLAHPDEPLHDSRLVAARAVVRRRGLEADPFFARDGSLYFISTRLAGSSQPRDLDIWYIERDVGGAFGRPVRMPEPVNSPSADWFPRQAADGADVLAAYKGTRFRRVLRAKKARPGAWETPLVSVHPGGTNVGAERAFVKSGRVKSLAHHAMTLARPTAWGSFRRIHERWHPATHG